MNQPIISAYSRVINGTASRDGKDLFGAENGSFSEMAKDIYRAMDIKYPKFFKMDNLSKLGFLAAETLLKDMEPTRYQSNEIAVVIANSSSSLDTDLEFYKTIEDKANFFPSPTVFVYTLPNILVGEICIRHHIKGENAFFIFEQPEFDWIYHYVIELFETGGTKACITGWVELLENQYEAILFFVESGRNQTGLNIPLTSENLQNIYLDKR